MLEVAPGHVYQQQSPAARQVPMTDLDTNRRLDGVRTHLHEKLVQRNHLRPRHVLHFTFVRHAAQQNAALCVRECGDFIGKFISGRTPGAISRKLHPLELPAAVLAQAELAADVFVAMAHRCRPATQTPAGR